MSEFSDEPPFKSCPMCNAQWRSIESFLADQDLSFNGYQANFGILDEGLFFFTHDTETCGSTMALTVRTFDSLYTGKKYPGRNRLAEDCPKLCNEPNNLSRCQNKCECAFAREISDKIKVAMDHNLQSVMRGKNSKAKTSATSSRETQSC